jgi:hypothetical protein
MIVGVLAGVIMIVAGSKMQQEENTARRECAPNIAVHQYGEWICAQEVTP